jgi:hypothetical protein
MIIGEIEMNEELCPNLVYEAFDLSGLGLI